MASETTKAPEKLIFDSDGDVLLVFTRRSKDGGEVPADHGSSSKKRKAPNDELSTVTMLVSSKHMELASPVFKAMLSRENFKEGVQLEANGKVEIPLPDDDPVAFTVIANVIHHRNKMVPTDVTPILLAQVLLLSDKYQMQEAMSLLSNNWVSRLTGDDYGSYDGDSEQYYDCSEPFDSLNTIAYVYIAYFLRQPVLFTKHTQGAILRHDHDFDYWTKEPNSWPISILDAIKKARLGALGEIFGNLKSFLDTQLAGVTICRKHDMCDLVTIGSFMRNASLSDFWPLPKAPYKYVSVLPVLQGVSNMEVQTWCGENGERNLCNNISQLWELQNDSMDYVESDTPDLYLKDFLP